MPGRPASLPAARGHDVGARREVFADLAAAALGRIGKHWLSARTLPGKFTAAIVVGVRWLKVTPGGGG